MDRMQEDRMRVPTSFSAFSPRHGAVLIADIAAMATPGNGGDSGMHRGETSFLLFTPHRHTIIQQLSYFFSRRVTHACGSRKQEAIAPLRSSLPHGSSHISCPYSFMWEQETRRLHPCKKGAYLSSWHVLDAHADPGHQVCAHDALIVQRHVEAPDRLLHQHPLSISTLRV